MSKGAKNSRNFTQCDSLLIEAMLERIHSHHRCNEFIFNSEHEATTSKIADEQLFYCMQRGISEEDAIGLIVSGFCKEVLNELPMEFAVEARALLQVNLEGAIG